MLRRPGAISSGRVLMRDVFLTCTRLRLLQVACGCPNRVDEPQRGRLPINELKDFLESVDVRHHGEPLDLAAGVGLQEGAVVLERHAAVGIAVRAEHVGVGEQATTAKHL